MPLTATGFLKQPYVLKHMLSASSSFQAVVGAASAAVARTAISLHDADESVLPLPRAIIERSDCERQCAGTSLAFSMDMSLTVHFEFRVPLSAGATDREDEEIWFMNQIAAILADIETQVNARQQVEGQNVLAIRRYRIVNGPDRITPEEDMLTDSDNEPSHNLPGWFVSVTFEMAG